jgi:hypothetical protein
VPAPGQSSELLECGIHIALKPGKTHQSPEV